MRYFGNRDVIIFFLIFFFLFTSCSIFKVQPIKRDEVVIYPTPPDKPRIQYLTTITNSSDINGKRSAFSKFILGDEKPIGISRPNGIHSTDGMIFICDVPIKGLEIIDLKKKKFNIFIPQGNGKLNTPVSCFVDSAGLLYVADVGRKEIIIFNTLDDYKYTGFIKDDGIFLPTGVIVHDDKIWVTNTPKNKIHVYDRSSLKLLFEFPKSDKSDESFLFSPNHICAFGNHIYITDFGDFKVKVFDLQGNYIKSIGSYGKSFGQFGRPKGIAVDKDENLYVVDASFENVQIFNNTGQVLMFFGGPYKGPGDMFLPKGIVIDYANVEFFKDFIDPLYTISYLILVTNQHGPDKVNVYGAIKY